MELTSVAGHTLGRAKMDCRITSRIPDRQQGTPFTKRRTDMPSDHKMRFFTPELYQRYNSPDDEIALAADTEWEEAIARYQQHLAVLHEKMPSQVIELSKLCLHDSEILQRQEQQHPLDPCYFEDWSGPGPLPFWHGLGTLAVRLEDELVILLYFLCDHITEQPAAHDWPFSKKHEHWLYDEVWQRDDRPSFTHLILLSSGTVLAIPFATVLISRIPLSPARAGRGKQSA
jgi:hypothetical protein